MVKRVWTKVVYTSWETINWEASDWYWYDGAVAMACGAPSGQAQLADAQAAFYTQQTADQKQLFAQEESLVNEINSVYGPIFQKGPNQLGFSQAELTALYSEAATGVGQNFSAENTALKENIATEGGGNIQLPSGALTKAEISATTAGAAQLSGEQNQILNADYAQGYSEFQAATNAMMSEGQILNPSIGMAGAANQGGEAANQTYSAIAAENNSVLSSVMGAVGGIGGALINQNPGNIFGK